MPLDIGLDAPIDAGLEGFTLPGPAAPVLFTIAVPVPSVVNVNTVAFTVNELGTVFGPFPAVATANTDGTYTLTVGFTSVPPGLSPGPISVQPGNWPAPQTDPATFVAEGDPVTGVLSSTGTTIDWDIAVDGPYLKLSPSLSGEIPIFEADGGEYVHLRWTVTDSFTGGPVVLTDNPDVLATEMAIVHGRPLSTDWQFAPLITRTVGDPMDGEYSRLLVGSGGLALTAGTWRVWARLTTTDEAVILKLTDYLIVL